MCGRYLIADMESMPQWQLILDALQRKKTPDSLKTAGEIFPTDVAPVLANSRKGDIQPFAMRWGYSFPNGRPLINARSETAAQKPMFKDGMKQRRCLIPASSYFEWERRGTERIRHTIRLQTRQMTYLAGIYHLERHGDIIVPAFAVLTREAVPEIRFIHERMPVLLTGKHADAWLDTGIAADEVLSSAAVQVMHSVS